MIQTKNGYRYFLAALIATFSLLTSAAHSAVLSVSTTAPTVDGLDIANLVAPTGSTLIYSDRPVQGQTFTTGGTAGSLTALTVMISETTGTVFEGWKDYRIRFGTHNDPLTTLTATVNQTPRYNPDLVTFTNYYFTFTLDAPIALAANTSYMFDVGVQASQEAWPTGIPSIHQSANTYAGGTKTSGAQTGQAATKFTVSRATNNDLIFHANIELPPAPDITVSGNDIEITDGDLIPDLGDFTDFGSTTVGSPLSRTFRVSNNGSGELTTSAPVLPIGFSLVDGLSDSIGPGLFDEFTVELLALSAGTYSGDIVFANNDADNNPFSFTITGEVTNIPEPASIVISLAGLALLTTRRRTA